MIALPPWLPQEHWNAWLDMRKKLRKPPTDFAMMLALKILYQLKAQGEDPIAVLEQSILRGWTTFYPVKDKPALAPQTDYEATRARQLAESTRKGCPPPEALKALRRSLH